MIPASTRLQVALATVASNEKKVIQNISVREPCILSKFAIAFFVAPHRAECLYKQ